MLEKAFETLKKYDLTCAIVGANINPGPAFMRGFNNPNHTTYAVVNVNYLEANFSAGDNVDKAALKAMGYLSKVDQPLKILGDGEITKALNVHADRFSGSARKKIEAAGGTCLSDG